MARRATWTDWVQTYFDPGETLPDHTKWAKVASKVIWSGLVVFVKCGLTVGKL